MRASRIRFLFLWISLWLLVGWQDSPSVMSPNSEQAREINNLWIFMLVLGTIVYVIVMGLLGVGLLRRRASRSEVETTPPPRGNTFIVVSGVIIPLVILAILFVFTLQTMAALSDEEPKPLRVQVIGHQYWWEVVYPDHGVITANEIHIPAGQPVEFIFTSADVIHSFWVPELNGKVDLIPGRTNSMFIDEVDPGVYRGQCAELCGLQHAKMAFYVYADAPADFEVWLTQQAEPAPLPESGSLALEGQQIFLGSSCVYCHTIRGTNASSRLGPDLTHLASRETIGAGILPNTRGHLAGWIVDAQSIKPGNQMPPMYLESEDLQALLTYLETLE